jgi:hypothetical protein
MGEGGMIVYIFHVDWLFQSNRSVRLAIIEDGQQQHATAGPPSPLVPQRSAAERRRETIVDRTSSCRSILLLRRFWKRFAHSTEEETSPMLVILVGNGHFPVTNVTQESSLGCRTSIVNRQWMEMSSLFVHSDLFIVDVDLSENRSHPPHRFGQLVSPPSLSFTFKVIPSLFFLINSNDSAIVSPSSIDWRWQINWASLPKSTSLAAGS